MRATGSQLAQAQGGAYVRSLSNMAGVGIKAVRPISDSASHVTLDGPMTLSEARAVAARLASDPMVEYAEPDVAMRPSAVPNETDFALKQWNLYPPASIYPGNVMVADGPAGEDHVGTRSGRCESDLPLGTALRALIRWSSP